MYALFGGYWGYLAAPLTEVQEQMLVIQARNEAKAEAEAEANAT